MNSTDIDATGKEQFTNNVEVKQPPNSDNTVTTRTPPAVGDPLMPRDSNSIPDELLVIIFEHVYESYLKDWHGWRLYNDPYKPGDILCQVSKRFRRIAESIPILWSFFSLGFQGHLKRNLTRCGKSRLHIELLRIHVLEGCKYRTEEREIHHLGQSSETMIRHESTLTNRTFARAAYLVTILRDHSEQLETFRYCFRLSGLTYMIQKFFNTHSGLFPNLRTVFLEACSESTEPWRYFYEEWNMPKLEELTLRGGIPTFKYPAPSLVTLRMKLMDSRVDLDRLLRLLTQFPSLQHFYIHFSSQILSIALTQSASAVTLDSLRTLKVGFPSSWCKKPELCILDYIKTPQIEHLHLIYCGYNYRNTSEYNNIGRIRIFRQIDSYKTLKRITMETRYRHSTHQEQLKFLSMIIDSDRLRVPYLELRFKCVKEELLDLMDVKAGAVNIINIPSKDSKWIVDYVTKLTEEKLEVETIYMQALERDEDDD